MLQAVPSNSYEKSAAMLESAMSSVLLHHSCLGGKRLVLLPRFPCSLYQVRRITSQLIYSSHELHAAGIGALCRGHYKKILQSSKPKLFIHGDEDGFTSTSTFISYFSRYECL